MTLIYELNLTILKMYLRTKNELSRYSRSRLSKVRASQTEAPDRKHRNHAAFAGGNKKKIGRNDFCRHMPDYVAVMRCRRLLECGADMDCRTLLGETPCHLAAYRGHCDVVRQLLAAGCDWTRRNWRGNDVVDEALAAADCRSALTAAVVLSTVTASTPSSPEATAAPAVSWSRLTGLRSKTRHTTF